MNKRSVLIAGALLSGVGVALGAIGTHALKELLTQNGRVETFEKAVRYQLYHGLALLMVGMIMNSGKQSKLNWSSRLFLAGAIMFSGSLYMLSLNNNIKWVVYITPLGGVLMLGGWAVLLLHFIGTKE